MNQIVRPFTYLKNEQQQLALIHDYQLTNDEHDLSLNRILRLMQNYYQVPMLGLIFFGKTMPFFKASIGLTADVKAEDLIFHYQYHCFKQIFVVLDSHQDEQFQQHTLVKVEPFIRFYASVPVCVKDREGNMAMIGKLCIMDNQPHADFDVQQQQALIDFSELIKDILNLNKKRQQSKRENDLRVAFLKNISHEILTPVSGIIGTLDLFKETALNHEQQEHLKNIKAGFNDVIATTKDVAELAKLLAGTIQFSKQTVNLREFSQQVLDYCMIDTHEKGVKIQLSCDKKLPVYVDLDTQKVRQILVSLVKNAIAFTQNEGYILLRSTKRGQNLIDFQVINTGVGISSEMQVVIFDAYHHADKSTHQIYAGVGLALSVCKAFAEGMGGSMKVASKMGQGTAFTLRLPLHEIVLEPVVIEPIVENFEVVDDTPNISAHVLIAEDNAMHATIVKKALAKFGYTYELAKNGDEAIELFSKNPNAYQIILMDHQMPIIDGVEAVKILKQKFDNMPPIIAVTAHATYGDTNIYFEAGMQDVLAKPYKPEILHQIMQHWLAKAPVC